MVRFLHLKQIRTAGGTGFKIPTLWNKDRECVVIIGRRKLELTVSVGGCIGPIKLFWIPFWQS